MSDITPRSTGWACDRDCILAEGHGGRSLFYNAQNKYRKHVWFSQQFAREHGDLLALAVEITYKPKGSWVWLRTKKEFLEVTRKKIAAKKPADVIAFVTEPELTKRDFSIVRNLFTVELAQRALTKIGRPTTGSAGV